MNVFTQIYEFKSTFRKYACQISRMAVGVINSWLWFFKWRNFFTTGKPSVHSLENLYGSSIVHHWRACYQCDQIGRFFKILGNKYSYKRSPNILVNFRSFLNRTFRFFFMLFLFFIRFLYRISWFNWNR